MLDECPPTGAAGTGRSQSAVQQLADGDDTDRALLIAQELLDRRRSHASLQIDQEIGVDQEGHGSLGGPTASRAARTSAAKSWSGRGALATRARKLSADISLAVGGAMIATGAPLRVTSTSSPAATRLSTSEKARAASVAVIRVMQGTYQINQSQPLAREPWLVLAFSRYRNYKEIVGILPTMAYVTARRSGGWELREARNTERGPRSRTLASFRTLTPVVIDLAIRRSESALTEADVRRAANRAGAPIARSNASAAGAALLAELAAGRRPSPPVARLLVEALSSPGGTPSDPERDVAGWIGATFEERGHALYDLLLLTDRLPVRPRRSTFSFPRIQSSP